MDSVAPFAAPLRTAELLSDFRRPWFVAGGWAIDLFVGRVTRDHQDLEVAIRRQDQGAFRDYLDGWTFVQVVEGERRPWGGARLELPIHELYATPPGGGPPLEVLLNESRGDDWAFRRDPQVRLQWAQAGARSSHGVPFLSPEIVLLYKAKARRPRDEHDFAVTRPRLGEEPRRWLARALQHCHPAHPWLDGLRD